jgi:hypothetical protein
MNKIIICLVLMLFASAPKADEVDLGDDFIYWTFLTETQKIDLIIKFKKLSNGAAYLGDDIPASIFKVGKCMESQESWGYYYEFEKRLELFQIMYVCADKSGWFSWPDLNKKNPRPKNVK